MDADNSLKAVAVVTDSYAPFHRDVIDELRPHLARAGYGTLCVAGRDVSASRFSDVSSEQRERIGSLGSHLRVAGAVIVSGAVPPSASADEVERFARELTAGPVVGLGTCLPGLASVTIDWDDAIDDLIGHMTDDPRRQRFVFIRGYAGDPHTAERERGFRAGMAAAGLEVDEELIVSGDYSAADSMQAVARLLADGHEFDGVVAANDDMAVGAVAALTAANISVPEQVIVSGFDNSWAALTSVPQLTTARLDTGRLTETTAELLVDAISSGTALDPSLVVRINSDLIIRRSSGRAEADAFAAELATTTKTIADECCSALEPIFAPPDLDLDWLSTAMATTLLTGDRSFSDTVDAIEHRAASQRSSLDEIAWWRHAIRQLYAVAARGHVASIETPGITVLLDQLRRLDQILRPLEMLTETRVNAEQQLQERLLMRLTGCSDTSTLWSTLRAGLQSLGVSSAWVAVNERDDADPTRPDMRLLFSLGEEDIHLGDRFSKSQILPDRFAGALEADLHVMVPLRVGSSDIGYMVVEPIGEQLLSLEAIASGVAQVLRHVQQVTDLEERAAQLRQANTSLDRLARFDSLTGLPNRKLFLERLDDHLAQVLPHEEVAVMYFDLDGFKSVNDTLGHEAGDRLLRIMTQRVLAALHDGETFARLGGDEFTLILSQPEGATRAARLSNAVLTAVAQPCVLGTTQVHVSASLGIAYAPRDGTTVDEIIRNADAAMYTAKARGKNRSATFTPELARRTSTTESLNA